MACPGDAEGRRGFPGRPSRASRNDGCWCRFRGHASRYRSRSRCARRPGNQRNGQIDVRYRSVRRRTFPEREQPTRWASCWRVGRWSGRASWRILVGWLLRCFDEACKDKVSVSRFYFRRASKTSYHHETSQIEAFAGATRGRTEAPSSILSYVRLSESEARRARALRCGREELNLQARRRTFYRRLGAPMPSSHR